MLGVACSSALRRGLTSVGNQSKSALSKSHQVWKSECGSVARLSSDSTNQSQGSGWRKWAVRGAAVATLGVGASIGMALVIRNDLGKYPLLAKLMDSVSGRKAKTLPAAEISDNSMFGEAAPKLKLLQYHTCPFSSKVRAYLDYHKIPYEIVEVNPISRSELPADFRKVPILMAGDYRLVESSVIISILESYRLSKGKVTFEELNAHFPHHEGERYGRKSEIYDDKFLIPTLSEKERIAAKREEELRWRKWVDDTFVHMLPPNIYRSAAEAKQAFDYISSVGNFGFFEAVAAQVIGATVMYMLAGRLKERYNLKEDVRESLYDCGNEWMEAVGDRKFLGGEKPNMADLAVFGTLTSVEGFDAFKDLMENTPMRPWWDRMVAVVRTESPKAAESS
ncbi:prostaglandin E synthase 2-like [Sycon ciliatum]|uniref:prostaglandin E synthase 2-like n=1 Tax=Sycon ciliatum TaxID=27933 RepID=UPI0031F66B1E